MDKIDLKAHKIRERLADSQMQVLEDCGPDRDGEGEHERQQAKRSRKRRASDGIIHALEAAPEATEAPTQRIRKR